MTQCERCPLVSGRFAEGKTEILKTPQKAFWSQRETKASPKMKNFSEIVERVNNYVRENLCPRH